jgi:plasmid stabilization system protein ParE
LDRLTDFLASENERAALRASQVIAEAVLSLAEFANRGRPARRRGWRELVARFGNAAYVIQYRVYETEVLVTRIFHSRERP